MIPRNAVAFISELASPASSKTAFLLHTLLAILLINVYGLVFTIVIDAAQDTFFFSLSLAFSMLFRAAIEELCRRSVLCSPQYNNLSYRALLYAIVFGGLEYLLRINNVQQAVGFDGNCWVIIWYIGVLSIQILGHTLLGVIIIRIPSYWGMMLAVIMHWLYNLFVLEKL